jgi:endogenous inhibitor of DNA gyrase (YacG/DUF329 family)
MTETNATRAAGSSAPTCSAPYGFCPICGANGITRERRLDGNDRCSAGHTYPSRNSVGEVRQSLTTKCPTCGRPNDKAETRRQTPPERNA